MSEMLKFSFRQLENDIDKDRSNIRVIGNNAFISLYLKNGSKIEFIRINAVRWRI